MINTERVAIFNGVKQLHKNVFDELVVTEIPTVVQDLSKQIAIRSIVHDDEGVVEGFNDTVESDNVGVSTSNLMEGYFTNMNLPLARLQMRVH